MKKIEAEDFYITGLEIEEARRAIFNTLLNRLGYNFTILAIADGGLPMLTSFERYCNEMPRERRKPMLGSIKASSYLGDEPGKTMTLANIPSLHLTFKQKIVLVDDVIDSGATMKTVARFLAERRQAKEIIAAALCVKGDLPTWVDDSYIGFQLPKNKFIIGAGMDYRGEYRAMPDIRPITPEEMESADRKNPMLVEEAPPEVVEVPVNEGV